MDGWIDLGVDGGRNRWRTGNDPSVSLVSHTRTYVRLEVKCVSEDVA